MSADNNELLLATSGIVAAYLRGGQVSVDELPSLIRLVRDALVSTDDEVASEFPRAEPAVPIDESVQPDYLVCLEDGKQLKLLKRHLMAHYNMTPAQYRERWGLPGNYPMAAPNYSARRSQLAVSAGLGSRLRAA